MRGHIENLNRTVNSWGMGRGEVFVRLVFGCFETSTGPLCNPKAVPGCTFRPHKFVFFFVQWSGFNSKLPNNKVTVSATSTSSRGQVLKESRNPASSSSKKTCWWKNRSLGCFLIKILTGFALLSRHLIFWTLYKEHKDFAASERSTSVLAN